MNKCTFSTFYIFSSYLYSSSVRQRPAHSAQYELERQVIMKKSFSTITKLAIAGATLMMASACSPTTQSDSYHYPQSSLGSSGSWSSSNAGTSGGNGYFYEYEGI
jgi:hypothetical protein